MFRIRRYYPFALAVLHVLAISTPAAAQDRDAEAQKDLTQRSKARPPVDNAALADLSIEELMSLRVQVTSASKRPEKWGDAAAAIFVVTAEDIRRGGFSCLPEVLRIVPGLYVAKLSADRWTISARGFAGYTDNKMLVLIDGRSVASPMMGVALWDMQDIPLGDVERIEVIRGPAGTLWGADATNGVINIVTKNSSDTLGASVTTSAGVDEGYSANVRYGGRIGQRTTYRISGRAAYFEPGVTIYGTNAYDFWNLSQGAIRFDRIQSARDDFVFETGISDGREHTEMMSFTSPGTPAAQIRRTKVLRSGYVLGRWNHGFSETSNGSLLVYCDWTGRTPSPDESRNTCRLQLQHNLQLGQRQIVTWGTTVETSGRHFYGNFSARGLPVGVRTNLFSSFAQYELAIVPDRLRLIAGSSFEYNSYTGFAVQPQIRAAWTPNDSHTVWAAVSRAISIPARFHTGEEYLFGQVPGAAPTFLTATVNPNLGPETVRAYELGYRFSPSKSFFLDTAIFYNHYEGLINLNLVNPLSVSGPPRIHTDPFYIEIAVPWQNLGPGQTHGLEVYGSWRPTEAWTLAAGVTELRGNGINLNDALNLPMLNSTRHQFNAQSHWDVNSRVGFDVCLYHYNGIRGYLGANVPWQNVPTHNRVDAGLTVRGGSNWTVSLWAKDIGSTSYSENRAPLFTAGGSQTRGQAITLGLTWSARPDTADNPNY